jgi:hypothetical protein
VPLLLGIKLYLTGSKGLESHVPFRSREQFELGFTMEPYRAFLTSTTSTIPGIGMRDGGLAFFLTGQTGRKSLKDSSTLDSNLFPHDPKTIFLRK